MNDLYSYDRYKGYDIYIKSYNDMFYGDIYLNGTCFLEDVKSNSGRGCLSKCEDWIDKEEEDRWKFY